MPSGSYPLLEIQPLLQGQRVSLGDDWDNVDHFAQSFHELNVQGSEAGTKPSDVRGAQEQKWGSPTLPDTKRVSQQWGRSPTEPGRGQTRPGGLLTTDLQEAQGFRDTRGAGLLMSMEGLGYFQDAPSWLEKGWAWTQVGVIGHIQVGMAGQGGVGRGLEDGAGWGGP